MIADPVIVANHTSAIETLAGEVAKTSAADALARRNLNTAIVEARGVLPARYIARAAGISRQRVEQIWAKAGAK